MPQIILPDGRGLEFQAFGPSTGRPLLFAHGIPGSGFALQVLKNAAADLGLRLISWSRPGYGTSTRHPGRAVAAQAAEVESILDHLDAPRCLVAGWSGGGPHALAAAALLPHRVDAALTISGLAPLADVADPFRAMDEQSRREFEAARRGEDALRAYLGEHLIAALSEVPLTFVDQAALDPRTMLDFLNYYHHGLASGLEGWIDDDLALSRLWGFDPAAIRVPVHIWHGTDDYRVPFTHAQVLAAAIPTATLHIESGHGHFSLLFANLPAMLKTLVEETG